MLMNNVFFLCFVWTINNIQQEEGIKQCSVWQQQQHQWCQRENRPWRRRHRTCCPGWSSCTCWCSPWSYQVRYHQHWQDLQWRQWPSDRQRELEYTSGSRTRKRFTQQTPRAFAVTSRHSRQILSPSLAALTIISASSYPHHDFSKSLYVFFVTNGTLFFGSLFQLHLDETNEAIGRSVLGDEGAWEKKKYFFITTNLTTSTWNTIELVDLRSDNEGRGTVPDDQAHQPNRNHRERACRPRWQHHQYHYRELENQQGKRGRYWAWRGSSWSSRSQSTSQPWRQRWHRSQGRSMDFQCKLKCTFTLVFFSIAAARGTLFQVGKFEALVTTPF